MTSIPNTSRQPIWQPWMADRLVYERSILLGMAIDDSTTAAYTSATNSYLTFCKLHNMLIDPTPETLSYYITFQSSHINPKSVESYLSGICNNLEPFFPEIRTNRATVLVKRTLKGALRRHGRPTKRKSPLSIAQLQSLTVDLANSPDHNDMLFLSMINTGFPGLLRLGEMAVSDNPHLRNFRKVVLRSSLVWVGVDFEFLLPAHKSTLHLKAIRFISLVLLALLIPNPSWRTTFVPVTGYSLFTPSFGFAQTVSHPLARGSFVASPNIVLLTSLASR